MPSGYFSNPLSFILDTLFSIYIGIIALRIIMQWAQWEYHNPLVQFIIRATRAPVKLLRKFIPSLGRWDTATIVFLLIVTAIKLLVLGALQSIPYTPIVFVSWLLFDVFQLFVTLFTVSIFVEVIIGWLMPHNTYNPIVPLVRQMNAPILSPLRRSLPPMAGLDFSPFIAILILQVLPMFVRPLLPGL